MIYEHKRLRQAQPGIVEGMGLIGSEQIQERPSISGQAVSSTHRGLYDGEWHRHHDAA
jgi:hypothetical protein